MDVKAGLRIGYSNQKLPQKTHLDLLANFFPEFTKLGFETTKKQNEMTHLCLVRTFFFF